LQVQSSGTGHCSLEFSLALSLRARLVRVRLNGQPVPSQVEANSWDQHVRVTVPLVGRQNTLEIQMKNNFELSVASALPALGATSGGLRVLSESWSPSRDTLTLLLSGRAAETYEFSAWNPDQIVSIAGAELEKKTGPQAGVRVQLPATTPGSDPRATVVFHFAPR
jgi:hypothetical protein